MAGPSRYHRPSRQAPLFRPCFHAKCRRCRIQIRETVLARPAKRVRSAISLRTRHRRSRRHPSFAVGAPAALSLSVAAIPAGSDRTASSSPFSSLRRPMTQKRGKAMNREEAIHLGRRGLRLRPPPLHPFIRRSSIPLLVVRPSTCALAWTHVSKFVRRVRSLSL